MLDFTAAVVALVLGAVVFMLIATSMGFDPGWGAVGLITGAVVGVWLFKNRR